MQLYIDKCIPQGETVACVALFISPPLGQPHAIFGGVIATSGGCWYARSLSWLKIIPPTPNPPTPHTHNCAAHNNILAQPRCSCWCQCLVVTQPKPSRGWLDQNMLIYCTFVILMWGLSPCGVRVGGSKHAHILYVLVILMWGLSLCGVRGAGSKHAHILYVLVVLMCGMSP